MARETPETHRARARETWQEKFLKAFAETGVVSDAAKVCGRSRATVYRERDRNEEFAAAWDDANEVAADVLEREAVRRAVEGVDEPVFHAGQEVGAVRRYSDRLLEFLLRARRPEKFRDNHRHEVAGEATVRFVLSPGEQHGHRDDDEE